MQTYVLRRVDQPDPTGIFPSREAAQAQADADADHDYLISECPFAVPPPTSRTGAIGWIDLTVENAEELKPFYEEVIGWNTSGVPMGEYEDYCLHPSAEDDPIAGLCHAKGPNAELPPAWLIYVTVADIEASLAAVERLGGQVIQSRAADSYGRIAIIKDPAGTPFAIFEPAN